MSHNIEQIFMKKINDKKKLSSALVHEEILHFNSFLITVLQSKV